MRKLVVCAAIAAGATTAALAADVVTRPDWLKKPTAEDLDGVWPAKALQQGISGIGVIRCGITVRGLLDRCAIVSENPAGAGFGAAALALAPRFLMRPKMVNGVAVPGGTVQIPINFHNQGGGGLVGETIRVLPVVPWDETPTAAQVAEAFPKGAIGKQDAGHVVMRCRILSKGELTACDALTETPKNFGFGSAAVKLSKYFRVKMSNDGKPLPSDVRVDVPVDFRSPDKPVPVRIANPQWTKMVSPEYSASQFPEKAVAAGLVSGRGVVNCEVAQNGDLTACRLVREEPAGLGFGEAALKLAGQMAMNPWTTEGYPAGGTHYQFAVRLDRPEDQPKPAAP